MANYRIYTPISGGKLLGGTWIDAPTDDEAIQLARALAQGVDCELWKGTQFIQQILFEDEQRPAPALA